VTASRESADLLPLDSWSNDERLARILTLLAASIAILIAVASPLGFFWLSYEAESRESAIAARLHAAFVTQAIGNSTEDWERSVEGLIETELSVSGLPEQRAIVASDGHRVSSSGPAVAAPTLTQTVPLVTSAGQVGTIVVVRSIQPILWRTGLVSAFALALGAATFLSLRLLPLRALRRTLDQLRRKEAESRERLEAELKVVLDNVIDGVLVVNDRGCVVSGNLAAARMLGYGGTGLVGLPIARILRTLPRHRSADPFPIGQFETVALRSNASEFPVDVGVSDLHGSHAQQRIGIVRDITERKQNEARLSKMANFDSLTGLPNRTLFRDRLHQAMARSRRTGQQFALMFLDLDRFKNINDSLGHDIGDKLLVAVANVLGASVRDSDSIARSGAVPLVEGVFRLGGDEFTILVEELDSAAPVAMIAQRILEALGRAFMVGDHELYISASIGITLFVNDGTDIDGLIKQADLAMYRSKELGRDTYFFFDAELNKEAGARHVLETKLRHALERGEFRLHYQPKADLASGRVIGVEALLRWQPAGEPLVGPDKFIPLLEETGLIVPVGAWAFREGCAQMMRWHHSGMRPITLAVNLSARQFRQQDLLGHIAQVLEQTGFPASRLEVELTESMLIADTDSVLQIMEGLGNMGVRIAIDDFGTGHSSLSYLKRFNVDTLKIDRSFVKDTPDDPEDSAIAIAVIALGHGLRLKVVAEGVETQAQVDFLRAQGCDEIQGYLLSRPLDSDAFERWFELHESRSQPVAA
jgi:diguanylate cyclase (GGDEF)-like protein/PAS domain S-box-containing protein